MHKRGQLTLFVIVGIVIIAIFAFLFFAVQTVSRSQLDTQVNQIFQQIVSSTALNYYVSLCSQQALEEGLRLIGEQGGKIYQDQGGPYPAQDFISFSGQNVSYAIKRDRSANVLDAPEYPCRLADINTSSFCFNYCCFSYPPSRFYRYSLPLLPQLCKSPADCRFEARSCPSPSEFCRSRSIQGQLEAYISSKTKECVRLESIAGFNTTYSLEKGNVTTNVTIGDADVAAVINFPILIRLAGTREPFARLAKFTATSPARLKQVYKFVDDVVKKNTESLDFDIFSHAGLSNEYRSDFHMTRFKDVQVYNDLFIINDTRPSTFQFSFKFAVENRIPVLNYVGKSTYDPVCGVAFDIAVRENSTFTLSPQGYDQDFDNLTYNYTEGWKVDRNESYPALQPNQNCPSLNIISTQTLTNNEWTSSSEYITTGRNATLFVNEGEIGIHNLTIKINDSEFTDWQIVKIFVYVMMRVVARVNNTYSDLDTICPNCTSLEDPFSLDADIYGGLPGGQFTYTWRDLTASTSPVSTSQLPYPFTGTMQTILVVVQSFLGPPPPSSPHNLELEVDTGTETTITTKQIRVFECLPHRSNNPSYPYNTSSDPFAGNHSCCSSQGTPGNNIWGTILGTSNICYSDVSSYGRYNVFSSSKYFANELDNGAAPGFSVKYYDSQGSEITGSITNTQYENDVFNRTFLRKCDGTRGNICGGSAEEIRKQMEKCDDTREGTSGQYRCSGPSSLTESQTQLTCIDYSGTTFEYQMGQVNHQFCNTAGACSAGNGQTYGGGGNYVCNATCTGSGANSGKCLTAANCQCITGQCRADCSSSSDYSWTNKDCKFGCSSCVLAQTQKTQCSQSQGSECLNDTGTKISGCYVSVSCDSSGAHSTFGSYCPITNTISASSNQYVTPSSSATNWCFYGTQGCASGACSLKSVSSTNLTRDNSCSIKTISESGIACYNSTTSTCKYYTGNACGESTFGWRSLTSDGPCSLADCSVTGCP